ncbi:hypothetical protein BJ508DRAFT_335405 [Ascobolus immersus RN42]|uniref:Uncharacterized protein n=1 Tax=Ascobolus immersus RN42 TaxID=1160509 RepID=A0A3N4HR00_ASCIM|nr:hypothetical protein BJ508DRAFT_335405 [Ascobolus immersus RN42]
MLPFPEEELYEMPTQRSTPQAAPAAIATSEHCSDAVVSVTGADESSNQDGLVGSQTPNVSLSQTEQLAASADGSVYVSSPGPMSPDISTTGAAEPDDEVGNATEYLNPDAELALVLSQYNHDADTIAELLCVECGIRRSLHSGTIKAIHVGSDNSPAMYDQSYPRLNEKVIFIPGIASNGTLGMVVVPFGLAPQAVVTKQGSMTIAPYGWARLGVDNQCIRDLIIVGHSVTGRITWVSDCFYWKRLFCNYHFEVEWEVSQPINIPNTYTVLGLARISEYLDSWVNAHSSDEESTLSSEQMEESSPLVAARPPGLIISTPHRSRQEVRASSPTARFLTDIGLTFSSAIGTLHSEILAGDDVAELENIPSSPPKPVERRLFSGSQQPSGHVVAEGYLWEESQLEVPDLQPLAVIDHNIPVQAGMAAADSNLDGSESIGPKKRKRTDGGNTGAIPSAFANATVAASFREDGDLEIRFDISTLAKRRKEN